MKYKTFNNLMTRLLKLRKDEEKLNEALRVFEPDFNFICLGRIETLIVDILKEATNDSNTWISYFLYEMDAKFSKKSIGRSGDKPIYIRNIKDLYNLIYDKSI
jgi:hypothetical protein